MLKIFVKLFAVSMLFIPIVKPEHQIRIAGGTYARRCQFPFQIILKHKNAFECGGAIYNKFYILTAAHCVVNKTTNETYSPENLTVVVGTNDLYDKYPEHSKKVAKVIVNPDYKPIYVNDALIPNDIALVKLTKPLIFSQAVQPIRLNTDTKIRDAKYKGYFHVAGWGRSYSISLSPTVFLKYIKVRIHQCPSIIPHVLCFRSAPGDDVCSGDSGGPITFNGLLVGIVTFGSSSCSGDENRIGAADVTYFVEWIKQNTH